MRALATTNDLRGDVILRASHLGLTNHEETQCQNFTHRPTK